MKTFEELEKEAEKELEERKENAIRNMIRSLRAALREHQQKANNCQLRLDRLSVMSEEELIREAVDSGFWGRSVS